MPTTPTAEQARKEMSPVQPEAFRVGMRVERKNTHADGFVAGVSFGATGTVKAFPVSQYVGLLDRQVDMVEVEWDDPQLDGKQLLLSLPEYLIPLDD